MNNFTQGPWKVAPNAHEILCVWSTKPSTNIIAKILTLPHENSLEANANLIASSPDLLTELKAAHQIIINALNIMSDDQKLEWDFRNERDGLKDGWALTREKARRTVIEKAEGHAVHKNG